MVRNKNFETETLEYISSVQVKNFNNIPEGFTKDTFPSSLCAQFRYIGQHHYLDHNSFLANPNYKMIGEFIENNHSKYTLLHDKVHFVRLDTSLYDGTYCQMEWYTPVKENI